MDTVLCILLILFLFPIMVLFLMTGLEIIASLLFITVKILDKITGYQTSRRFQKNKDNEYDR